MEQIESFQVEYKCPQCKRKTITSLSYISPDMYTDHIVKKYWCKNCSARHQLIYFSKKIKDEFKVSIVRFECEEKKAAIKMRVIGAIAGNSN